MDPKSILRLISNSSPLIIHHWDCDGVVSAVTIASYIGRRVSFESPPFKYTIDDDYLEMLEYKLEDHDVIIVVDLNLSPKYLVLLSYRLGRPVVSIDHHTTKEIPRHPSILYYNPAKDGDPQGIWPSAAHVIATLTGFYDPLLIASSIVGDLGSNAKNNRVYMKYMNEIGLDPIADFNLPNDCSMQIWGAEAMGKIDIIKNLPSSLLYGGLDPCYAILNDPILGNLRYEAEEELKRLVSKAENTLEAAGRNFYATKLDGNARLVSKVARKVSSDHPNDIIMIGYLARSINRASIYIRTRRIDVNLIDLLKSINNLGYKAGGKFQRGNNVLAVDVEPEKLDEAFNDIMDIVRKAELSHTTKV
ncbi:MAG: DHH family phosphoesterase [Caldisphaeraceae archaeon]|nr:DHH family phosphoesterase [Caldisphaeraceae archaeon]